MSLCLGFDPRRLAVAAVLIAGCTDSGGSGPDGSKGGELGEGRFRYACLGGADPACADGASPSVFPEAIAVGGLFRLSYDPDEAGAAVPVVVTASTAMLRTESSGLRAMAPGLAAVFAQHGTGDVVDLLHLRLVAVERIQIQQSGQSVDRLEIPMGEGTAVRATPIDIENAIPAGSLAYVWTSSDPSVVRVVAEGTDDEVVLEGESMGTATVTVDIGDVSQTLEITVVEAAATTGADTEGGSGGSDDTGGSGTGDSGGSSTGTGG